MTLVRLRNATAAILTVLVLAACSAAPGTSNAFGPSSAPVVPTATPNVDPSQLASVMPSPAGKPSPSTGLAPSPAPTPESWYPWLPPIDTTVVAEFGVDTFVTGRGPVVPVSATPGGPPLRSDTGDAAPLRGFQAGWLLVVLHGPVVVDDMPWYLLTPATNSSDIPTGWSPALSPDAEPYLERWDVVCPTDPISIAQLAPIGLMDGFPACYGSSEVTITGDLSCDAEPHGWATGPAWLEAGVCRFAAPQTVPPTVFGVEPNLEPGTYAVTGHFLDEGARDCQAVDGETFEGDPLGALLYCRRAFVATLAEPVID